MALILISESCPDLRRVWRNSLVRGGHCVEIANDGMQAVKAHLAIRLVFIMIKAAMSCLR